MSYPNVPKIAKNQSMSLWQKIVLIFVVLVGIWGIWMMSDNAAKKYIIHNEVRTTYQKELYEPVSYSFKRYDIRQLAFKPNSYKSPEYYLLFFEDTDSKKHGTKKLFPDSTLNILVPFPKVERAEFIALGEMKSHLNIYYDLNRDFMSDNLVGYANVVEYTLDIDHPDYRGETFTYSEIHLLQDAQISWFGSESLVSANFLTGSY